MAEETPPPPQTPPPSPPESQPTPRTGDPRRDVREQYVRHCLQVLAPQPGDGALTYRDLLERLQSALSEEIAAVPQEPEAPQTPPAA